jgi:hypothetical protein
MRPNQKTHIPNELHSGVGGRFFTNIKRMSGNLWERPFFCIRESDALYDYAYLILSIHRHFLQFIHSGIDRRVEQEYLASKLFMYTLMQFLTLAFLIIAVIAVVAREENASADID